MLTNPEALIGMPGMFSTSHGVHSGGSIVPNMPNAMGNQQLGNAFSVSRSGQQPQQQQYLPQVLPNLPQHQQLAPNTATAQQMMSQGYTFQVPIPSTLGGVPIPPLPPHSSTAMQVQVAAAAAAAAAAPLKNNGQSSAMQIDDRAKGKKAELSPQEKARQNRDRNREHARSTRLRKKAYVQKLKELVEGLHAERTEEVRKRRVAIQHLSEVQGVRRAVVRSFLHFHASYESDPRKWSTIVEDNFWLRQPVTPYRSFRRAEVEHECRISRGIDAMIADSASVSVMIECVGSRSCRWMQLKRDELLSNEGGSSRSPRLPQCIDSDSSRRDNGVSSLSSSSGSSNGSGGGVDERQRALTATQRKHQVESIHQNGGANKVSSSSGSSNEGRNKVQQGSNDFHDYDAPALPDPMLGDSEGSSPSDSPEDSNGGPGEMGGKHTSTDSSSGEEEKPSELGCDPSFAKKRKIDHNQPDSNNNDAISVDSVSTGAFHRAALPPNIAKKGGISHNIRPVSGAPIRSGNGRLNLAPAVPLPPFVGIGKKAALPSAVSGPVTVGTSIVGQSDDPPPVAATTAPKTHQLTAHTVGPTTVSSSSTHDGAAVGRTELAPTSIGGTNVIAPDLGNSSSRASKRSQQIRAYYHVNEDDMLLTEDNLMCPFVFRTQGAVLCGALSECVMPGMLRCNFSQRNKLLSVEMIYDAMGFMQQLERASGTDNLAQVVPGSLEMALAPNSHEARVITMAKSPYLIVSVNEAWTRTTKYTQMEVEGRDLSILNGIQTNPEASVRSGKPVHKYKEAARGICACSTNIHYDKEGRDFAAFVCSFPLTK
jgi:hypothetical protein